MLSCLWYMFIIIADWNITISHRVVIYDVLFFLVREDPYIKYIFTIMSVIVIAAT